MTKTLNKMSFEMENNIKLFSYKHLIHGASMGVKNVSKYVCTCTLLYIFKNFLSVGIL